MKTIHKLVLKSYLGPMVLTFFIVMFVLMMNFVWRWIDELVGKGLDAGVIIELMCYAMVNMISLGLPLATLLAAIMTMGNLGENYELLAMKSAGMSLPQILKPLILVVGLISVGSFFVMNNLSPYTNRKMFSLLYDIKQQNQAIEFSDGIFFSGIPNMNIRVGHQDPDSKLLTDVLIYDNRSSDGNMQTIVADSGYIRLSDSKKFLMVTLFHGESYEQTRNSKWYNESELTHNIFNRQDMILPMEGFSMERSDEGNVSNSRTKGISELQRDIDSLEISVNDATARSYGPLLNDNIFARDKSLFIMKGDSAYVDKSLFRPVSVADSLPSLSLREHDKVWNSARSTAKGSRNRFSSFDEENVKYSLNQLYSNKVEWHRIISLPVSIMIFFLIGAPLGAIIRKGGLGTPVVISVLFFVFYYVISLSGEKMVKEGNWEAVYGMWLSAFVLTPIAIYLTKKATNDSALLDVEWYDAKFKALKEWVLKRVNKVKEKYGKQKENT